MLISLSGVLERAADYLPRKHSSQAYMLRQLLQHLEWLRTEHAAGRGAVALDTFFALWVVG